MKKLLTIWASIFTMAAYAFPADWTEKGRTSENQQIRLWEKNLSKIPNLQGNEKIDFLSNGLRSMSHWKEFDDHNPKVDEIYRLFQIELLSISGHAQYFANLISGKQKDVEHLPPNTGERVNYDYERSRHFEILGHLPSPETVKVLGDYLSDERDRHEMTPEETKGQSCISGGSTGNSTHSAKALEKSALRNKPYREGTVYDIDVAKATWRAWWDQIKSGNRTFSFVGQKVEYRFKPDGTWETLAMTNPPDDAPKSTKRVIETAVPTGNSWPWIIGAAMIGLTVVVWFGLRRSPADP